MGGDALWDICAKQCEVMCLDTGNEDCPKIHKILEDRLERCARRKMLSRDCDVFFGGEYAGKGFDVPEQNLMKVVGLIVKKYGIGEMFVGKK